MVNIIMGATNKPLASEKLKEYFQNNNQFQGELYIGYPIIGTVEGAYSIDALWISKDKGLVIFNLIENKNIDNYQNIQDDCANKVEAKLRGYKELMNKRKLCVDINVITFAPFVKNLKDLNEDYPLCNNNNLEEFIKKLNVQIY